jgi:hypothetical protein
LAEFVPPWALTFVAPKNTLPTSWR